MSQKRNKRIKKLVYNYLYFGFVFLKIIWNENRKCSIIVFYTIDLVEDFKLYGDYIYIHYTHEILGTVESRSNDFQLFSSFSTFFLKL